MSLRDLGLIGNCQYSALVHRDGRVVWCCLPRADAPPVFGALLDDDAGGSFGVGAADGSPGVQQYLPNTNVLETRFEGREGAFRVLDFAPRFELHGRSFRPTKLIRVVEPLTGTPRIRVRCDPAFGWSRARPRRELGSHHVSYRGFDQELRLTTDAPLSYLGGDAFALTSRRHFVLAWGAPIEEPLEPLCDRFLRETVRYWQTWVKRCEIPARYQDEVIRSALTLKLHCYEDTGAIVGSTTTSVPQAPGARRTWDDRYCRLRDAYYTLDAFRLLGQYEEREQFQHYLLDIAGSSPSLELAPLYRIDGRCDLQERELSSWPGYRGEGPVRLGNDAASRRQNDVYGEMVLALTPLFLDARLRGSATRATLDLVQALATKAAAVAGAPEASPRAPEAAPRAQTFSTMMCWAAVDRMARIASTYRRAEATRFSYEATRIQSLAMQDALHPERGCLVASHGGRELDVSLLHALPLRLLAPGDPRAASTVRCVLEDLQLQGWLRRDGAAEDAPPLASVSGTFWLVEALAMLGRVDEARSLLDRAIAARSQHGLLSDVIDPRTDELWGNYPHISAHVGLIHAAFAASPSWQEVL